MARHRLARAAHEALVLLLEVVQVRAGAGELVGQAGVLGLGGRQGIGLIPRGLRALRRLGIRARLGRLPRGARRLGGAEVDAVEGGFDLLGQARVDGLVAGAVALGSGSAGAHLDSSSSTISASTMSSSLPEAAPVAPAEAPDWLESAPA